MRISYFAVFLFFSVLGPAHAADEKPMSSLERIGFMKGCMPTCPTSLRGTPTFLQAKITEPELARLCNCHCNRTADRISSRMLNDTYALKDEKKMAEAVAPIVEVALKSCFMQMIDERKKK